MASILGVVGSARRWGNCDLLVRHALDGARHQGASVELLRLTHLDLKPCTGCLRCVIGSKPCPIDDDMSWLVDRLQAVDGLVLAAPTYFLGPAAVVKLVLDRLLTVLGPEGQPPSTAARPAMTLATAGLPGWRGITLPYLNLLAAAFGFRSIASLTAVAPGPGEVLLDDELMAGVLAAGGRVGRGELEACPVPPNTCPICRCDSFVLEGNQATCPICGLQGTIEQEGKAGPVIRFGPTQPAGHRWTPEALRRHMVDWVMATGPRHLALRPEIKSRRRQFREADIVWARPQGNPHA
ncbi:flavodoxin family protein [Chloroflexota bacterium]